MEDTTNTVENLAANIIKYAAHTETEKAEVVPDGAGVVIEEGASKKKADESKEMIIGHINDENKLKHVSNEFESGLGNTKDTNDACNQGETNEQASSEIMEIEGNSDIVGIEHTHSDVDQLAVLLETPVSNNSKISIVEEGTHEIEKESLGSNLEKTANNKIDNKTDEIEKESKGSKLEQTEINNVDNGTDEIEKKREGSNLKKAENNNVDNGSDKIEGSKLEKTVDTILKELSEIKDLFDGNYTALDNVSTRTIGVDPTTEDVLQKSPTKDASMQTSQTDDADHDKTVIVFPSKDASVQTSQSLNDDTDDLVNVTLKDFAGYGDLAIKRSMETSESNYVEDDGNNETKESVLEIESDKAVAMNSDDLETNGTCTDPENDAHVKTAQDIPQDIVDNTEKNQSDTNEETDTDCREFEYDKQGFKENEESVETESPSEASTDLLLSNSIEYDFDDDVEYAPSSDYECDAADSEANSEEEKHEEEIDIRSKGAVEKTSDVKTGDTYEAYSKEVDLDCGSIIETVERKEHVNSSDDLIENKKCIEHEIPEHCEMETEESGNKTTASSNNDKMRKVIELSETKENKADVPLESLIPDQQCSDEPTNDRKRHMSAEICEDYENEQDRKRKCSEPDDVDSRTIVSIEKAFDKLKEGMRKFFENWSPSGHTVADESEKGSCVYVRDMSGSYKTLNLDGPPVETISVLEEPDRDATTNLKEVGNAANQDVFNGQNEIEDIVTYDKTDFGDSERFKEIVKEPITPEPKIEKQDESDTECDKNNDKDKTNEEVTEDEANDDDALSPEDDVREETEKLDDDLDKVTKMCDVVPEDEETVEEKSVCSDKDESVDDLVEASVCYENDTESDDQTGMTGWLTAHKTPRKDNRNYQSECDSPYMSPIIARQGHQHSLESLSIDVVQNHAKDTIVSQLSCRFSDCDENEGFSPGIDFGDINDSDNDYGRECNERIVDFDETSNAESVSILNQDDKTNVPDEAKSLEELQREHVEDVVEDDVEDDVVDDDEDMEIDDEECEVNYSKPSTSCKQVCEFDVDLLEEHSDPENDNLTSDHKDVTIEEDTDFTKPVEPLANNRVVETNNVENELSSTQMMQCSQLPAMDNISSTQMSSVIEQLEVKVKDTSRSSFNRSKAKDLLSKLQAKRKMKTEKEIVDEVECGSQECTDNITMAVNNMSTAQRTLADVGSHVNRYCNILDKFVDFLYKNKYILPTSV